VVNQETIPTCFFCAAQILGRRLYRPKNNKKKGGAAGAQKNIFNFEIILIS